MTPERRRKQIDRLLHVGHLKYQRQQLRPEKVCIPSSEIRGCRVIAAKRVPPVTWLPEWSSHLRPNFWKAYFDTLTYMAK